MHAGPEHVVDRAWHLRREIQDLEGYDSTKGYLGTRNDEGRFVREKAKELATLLDDFDQIRELRADAAMNTYEGDKPRYNEGASGRYDSYSGGGGFERSRRLGDRGPRPPAEAAEEVFRAAERFGQLLLHGLNGRRPRPPTEAAEVFRAAQPAA